MYDFYYSREHEAHLMQTHQDMDEIYNEFFVNGKVYTEAVKEGQEPTVKKDDLKKVCTASLDKVEVKYWKWK